MPRVGFEPRIPMFEQAKTVHALGHAATVYWLSSYYKFVLYYVRRATGWTPWIRFPSVQGFPLFHSLQTYSGAHPAFYPMGTVDSFPGVGGKAAGACS
jgi:hypothetical protein